MLLSSGLSHLLLALSLSPSLAAGHDFKRQVGSLISSLGLGGSPTGSSSAQLSISLGVSSPQVLSPLLPSGSDSSGQASQPVTSGPPSQTSSELPSQVTTPTPTSSSSTITPSASLSSSLSSSSSTTPSSTSHSSSTSSTITRASTFTTPLVSNEVHSTVYTTIFTSNGAAFTSSVQSNSTIAHTTGYATVTQAPALNESGSGDSSSSGLSPSSKKIIGGVVGGVGGAIFLGALAAVAWRLRRKRNVQPDAYGYNTKEDYSSGPSSRYPSGNDAATNPTTVNQSSNF